ncbi:MAG: iron-sulfur cluster assembly accessory protein [Methylococcales bacterium]|nr:iron-sulfur cluster assembly accessory protein [Methylococcales bacterium]MDD5753791.1 iron-sulfur cluster assembly accessory protein [Methylococcales bacterium]
MSVSVTESAAQQIQKQLTKRGSGLGLRLGVKKSGCSGYAYVLNYVDSPEDNDQIFDLSGVKIVVNGNDLPLLEGIEIDYQKSGLNAAFKFNNPNAKGMCGCGESFAV